MMKRFAVPGLCLLMLRLEAQHNPAVVFDFDSVKVYSHYTDVLSVLKRENKAFGTTMRQAKNDSIHLHGSDLLMSEYGGSKVLDMEEELFHLIDRKRASVIYKGKSVKTLETRKGKRASDGKKEFAGLYYYDAATKKHVLTKTLYKRQEPAPFPDF